MLVVNGHNDIMIPTINSFTLSQHIPDAQLIIYPDSGHGSLFQYPGCTTGLGFATAERFLSEEAEVVITGRRQAELGMARAGMVDRIHGGCRTHEAVPAPGPSRVELLRMLA
jgi:hypothetical protein